MIPQNMPGSGGIKTILHLYSVAPRDGTTLGMLSRSYRSSRSSIRRRRSTIRRASIRLAAQARKCLSASCGTPTASRRWAICKRNKSRPAQQARRRYWPFPTLLRNLTGAKIKIVTGYPGGNERHGRHGEGRSGRTLRLSWGSLRAARAPGSTKEDQHPCPDGAGEGAIFAEHADHHGVRHERS